MADRKTIAIVGATGAQGNGLVRAILEDPSGGFAARALTRNVDSAKARQLAELGADVVAADVDDLDSLEHAFTGCHGAFCVTFFWEHFSPAKEAAHARNMAEAAGRTNLRHVIWSTLEDTRRWIGLDDDRMPTLGGAFKVPHFDAKGASDDVFRELGVPTTFLRTSFYWDNLIHFGMGPKSGPDGALEFTLPMGSARLPGIAAEDIGRCAYGIFKRGSDLIGATVGVAGEHLTGEQMAAALSSKLGRAVRYSAIEPEVYRGLGFPGADDLGNMFQFKRDFEDVFCGHRDIALSRSLNPELQTFDRWLAANASRIPVE